jgi:hypothetical protein
MKPRPPKLYSCSWCKKTVSAKPPRPNNWHESGDGHGAIVYLCSVKCGVDSGVFPPPTATQVCPTCRGFGKVVV